jgi:hypothetical protein
VDSQSSDGSVDFIRQNLAHPRLRILDHPPGLYASWNHGLRQLATEYAYISTVGDVITRDGVLHLLAVARRFEAEVVLSPPLFVDETGRPRPRKQWSIHQYLNLRGITQPCLLPRSHFFVNSVIHGAAGFLGSSASNLYRTRTLQAQPFPTDYGHVGDTAWGLVVALTARAAVTPQPCAHFVIHPPAEPFDAFAQLELDRRLRALARQVVEQARLAQRLPADGAALTELVDRWEALGYAQWRADHTWDECRRRSPLWFLSGAAWECRRQRKELRRSHYRLWRDALESAGQPAGFVGTC